MVLQFLLRFVIFSCLCHNCCSCSSSLPICCCWDLKVNWILIVGSSFEGIFFLCCPPPQYSRPLLSLQKLTDYLATPVICDFPSPSVIVENNLLLLAIALSLWSSQPHALTSQPDWAVFFAVWLQVFFSSSFTLKNEHTGHQLEPVIIPSGWTSSLIVSHENDYQYLCMTE